MADAPRLGRGELRLMRVQVSPSPPILGVSMANIDPQDKAREHIEEMQRINMGRTTLSLVDPMAEDTVSKRDYEKLKERYQNLKRIIVNALIGLDWTIKVGSPVALWFWPLAQDHVLQSIGIAGYIIILTIISKTITKVKTHEIE